MSNKKYSEIINLGSEGFAVVFHGLSEAVINYTIQMELSEYPLLENADDSDEVSYDFDSEEISIFVKTAETAVQFQLDLNSILEV